MNGTATPHDHYNHSRHQSYQAHPTVGTPLSNIPERAVHAQLFQPYAQSAYAPPAYSTHSPYYYQPSAAAAQYAGAPMMPMYAQNPTHGAYMAPNTLNAAAPGASPPAPVQQPQQPVQQTSTGMVAHEQNGMVYYYDPSQMYVAPAPVAAPPPPQQQQQQQQQPPPQQQPEGYAPQPQQGYGVGMVGQPGDGAYYYHPQQHHHHQQVAASGAVYYPPQ
jgi:hypothetical protein